jgi:hypothetical protein
MLAVSLSSAAGAATWGLPYKGEDFADNERIYWHRDFHSKSGVQKFGYDLEIRLYDSKTKKWQNRTSDANKDWYVYDRPVYAMEGGKVIACWRNAPENPKIGVGPGFQHEELTKYRDGKSRIYGGGNGFWIEHADGSRAEYAHFIPGTVPKELCPHNETLMPAIIDSPLVKDAWTHIRVPKEKQATIKRGQFLGRSGNAGTSSNPHLHIHRETGGIADATKSGGSPLAIDFKSGLFAPYSEDGPNVTWASFAGKPIPSGPVLVWPSVSLGVEYARHGFASGGFGPMFQHLTDSGYWPVWIDYYDVGGKTFVNHVWRPASGGFLTYLLNGADEFQNNAEDAVKKGFKPVFVESSNTGGKARYTGVFVKNQPGDFILAHGVSEQKMIEKMTEAKNRGLSAVNVSIVPAGNALRYTALFRAMSNNWTVLGAIAEDKYQAEYIAQGKAGRKPVSLSAYMLNGKPTIAAVFAAIAAPTRKDRHGMSGSLYQDEYASALRAGMLTRSVSAFDGASSAHRFAAAWWK